MINAISTARALLAEPSLGPVQALEPAQPLSFDSVRLFCERAAAVRPDHATENAPAIAAICRQLDGIPLDAVLASTRPAVSTRQPTLAFHPVSNQCEARDWSNGVQRAFVSSYSLIRARRMMGIWRCSAARSW